MLGTGFVVIGVGPGLIEGIPVKGAGNGAGAINVGPGNREAKAV